MEQFLTEMLNIVNYYQAVVISIAVFLADFMTGVTAGLRSGRRIRSSVMHQSLSKKVSNYFFFLIIGLAFYLASKVGSGDAPLHELAAIITLVPAVPELLSVYENIKIAWTKRDTKPKREENENDSN